MLLGVMWASLLEHVNSLATAFRTAWTCERDCLSGLTHKSFSPVKPRRAKILQQKEASVFLGYNLEEAIFTVSVWLEFKTS